MKSVLLTLDDDFCFRNQRNRNIFSNLLWVKYSSIIKGYESVSVHICSMNKQI